jgi:hypothetical protein
MYSSANSDIIDTPTLQVLSATMSKVLVVGHYNLKRWEWPLIAEAHSRPDEYLLINS